MTGYLTPAFIGPNKAFTEAMYGKIDTPPRDRLVAVEVETALGHPLGQLYVAKYFSPETRKAAEALVSEIKAEFRGRIARSTWLSPATRREALAKIDALQVKVGYPAQWIDYTRVDIRRDDYFGNVVRLNEFKTQRDFARYGKPVKEDTFAIANATLPTVVNAAYQPSNNSIEIPAAFLQPPFYDAKADAAVNYCALGAVIGHEFTHGFDSHGRLYDAKGNLRDWWTPADAKHFAAEAQKLVTQAAAVEVLPGLYINGELSVGENLADVGGISFAHAALVRHLRRHPQDNRTIDGLDPMQRCYLDVGTGVGRQGQRRLVEADAARRRTSAGRLPDAGGPAARARVLRCIPHSCRRSDVARPEEPGRDLVIATPPACDVARRAHPPTPGPSMPSRLRRTVQLMIVASALTLTATHAADAIRKESVQFRKGASEATIKGRIKGDTTIDYRVRAGAGQTLTVALQGSNPQNFFNVLPPGSADVAMFVGQDGGGYKGVLPTDGDYTIRVYLMRPAARRNESSNYTLNVGVTGKALAPLPAAKDALVPGTRFHASAPITCTPPFAPKPQPCEAFVIRRGFDGTATVEVRSAGAPTRSILFVGGVPVASDATEPITQSREGDLAIVKIGADERYEIRDALIQGG